MYMAKNPKNLKAKGARISKKNLTDRSTTTTTGKEIQPKKTVEDILEKGMIPDEK